MQDTAMGFWPFDSEQDKNLNQAVAAAAIQVKERVWPQLSVVQKAAWSAVDVYRAPWEQFVVDYMRVANALRRPYTNNAEFYSVWLPRMKAYGWDEGILEKLMFALRTLGVEGKIPREVMNPAQYKAAGDDTAPINVLGGAATAAANRVLVIGAVAAVGYFLVKGFITGSVRPSFRSKS